MPLEGHNPPELEVFWWYQGNSSTDFVWCATDQGLLRSFCIWLWLMQCLNRQCHSIVWMDWTNWEISKLRNFVRIALCLQGAGSCTSLLPWGHLSFVVFGVQLQADDPLWKFSWWVCSATLSGDVVNASHTINLATRRSIYWTALVLASSLQGSLWELDTHVWVWLFERIDSMAQNHASHHPYWFDVVAAHWARFLAILRPAGCPHALWICSIGLCNQGRWCLGPGSQDKW